MEENRYLPSISMETDYFNKELLEPNQSLSVTIHGSIWVRFS